ncbi:MAG: hypothetical protein DWQ01_18665 [Planctomycetota bacterium]|nr:MAG: hypothetical protein DWQ01_18665 [Planctomycetota bacterium]
MTFLLLFTFTAGFQQPGGKWIQEFEGLGSSNRERFGGQVTSLGDLNGDQSSEILVTSPLLDLGDPGRLGQFEIFSGADGTLIYKSSALDYHDATHLGTQAKGAGDFNQDGVPDFALTSVNPNGPPNYSVMIFSGLDFSLMHRIWGPLGYSRFGRNHLEGKTDLNGDGVPDLLIGDADYSINLMFQGAVYAYDSATWNLMWVHEGQLPGTQIGWSHSSIADINGDSIHDVLTSSWQSGPSGSIHLLSGVDGTEIYRIDGTQYDYSLGSGGLIALNDVTGDGCQEFVAGSISHPSGSTGGHGYLNIYSGLGGGLIHQIQSESVDEWFPGEIVLVGDIDDDGFQEFATSDRTELPGFGKGTVYVYSSRNWQVMGRIPGPKHSHVFGFELGAGADVTGDGHPDLLVGDDGVVVNQMVNAGAAYIYSFEPFLRASAKQVSASSGGQVDFDLQFPPEEAGKEYRMLVSTDLPGSIVLGKMEIPLEHTPLTWAVAHNPPNWFTGSRGTLDANAHATASAIFPANKFTSHVGTTLKFVALTMRPIRKPDRSSAAVYVEIVP